MLKDHIVGQVDNPFLVLNLAVEFRYELYQFRAKRVGDSIEAALLEAPLVPKH